MTLIGFTESFRWLSVARAFKALSQSMLYLAGKCLDIYSFRPFLLPFVFLVDGQHILSKCHRVSARSFSNSMTSQGGSLSFSQRCAQIRGIFEMSAVPPLKLITFLFDHTILKIISIFRTWDRHLVIGASRWDAAGLEIAPRWPADRGS